MTPSTQVMSAANALCWNAELRDFHSTRHPLSAQYEAHMASVKFLESKLLVGDGIPFALAVLHVAIFFPRIPISANTNVSKGIELTQFAIDQPPCHVFRYSKHPIRTALGHK
jgi:hypothetical protein